MIELLVLAAIAVFLILRLRSVLGTREGFEKPPVPQQDAPERSAPKLDVIEGGPDRDITDHVEHGSPSEAALIKMKKAEPGFSVSEFLAGARGAYEMILMAFERGDLSDVRGFLAPDVAASLDEVIAQREAQGLSIDATFVGISGLDLREAEFDEATGEGAVTVRFVGELTSVVRNAAGEIVEGDPNTIQKQADVWTFGRIMGASNPNWQLVATGE